MSQKQHQPQESPEEKDPVVPRQDLWAMLLSTLRYALTRRSYFVGVACDLYRKYRVFLMPHQRRQVLREIEEVVRVDRECRGGGYYLGEKMVDTEWRKLAEEIRQEFRPEPPYSPQGSQSEPEKEP